VFLGSVMAGVIHRKLECACRLGSRRGASGCRPGLRVVDSGLRRVER
jgi:hypothetical protein